MSVYARFKRDPEGFRKLIELLESTPSTRRQKMIDVGMAEDRAYTERALKYVMTFADILGLPDLELAEVVNSAPTRMTGFAVCNAAPDVQERFLRNSMGPKMGEIKEYMEVKANLREIGAAQLKLIEVARGLEKRGLVKAKRIPLGGSGQV